MVVGYHHFGKSPYLLSSIAYFTCEIDQFLVFLTSSSLLKGPTISHQRGDCKWFFHIFSQKKKTWRFLHKYIPIESIYGISICIWLIFMVNLGKYTSRMDPMGIDIQYAILAKKAFIHLPRSGVKKHKLNHLGKGKIFTEKNTSEVEQFAPEKLPKPKRKGIVFELAPFSGSKMLNFRWVKLIFFEARPPKTHQKTTWDSQPFGVGAIPSSIRSHIKST